MPDISELYNRIGEHVESLPQQLNRLTGDATDSSSENSATEESQVSRDLNGRREIVQDILSVFDPNALAGEYGQNFQQKDKVRARASENLYVPGNLAATIYEIAIRDEAFYRRLRKVVTPDICAKSYFSRQLLRAREVMSRLDRFAMRKGSSEPQPDGKKKDVDVPECARIIQLIVHQICTERDARASKGPLEALTSMNAAEILVDILAEVVYNRDKDVYHQGERERDRGHDDDNDNEPRRNRNLYLYLIGDPPPPPPPLSSSVLPPPPPPFGMIGDDDNDNNDDDFFIISRMIRYFPPSEWSHLLERLTTILDHIQEKSTSTTTTTEGSKAFARKLESILREYTEDVFEPSTSSGLRRRPTTSPPARQRRRYV